jgi:hypothetical protein
MRYFYRIGNQTTGLWYNKIGNFTGVIHTDAYAWLGASALEMPFDEEIKGFLSVADSLEHLYQWFSKEEILKLQEEGFCIEEWVATTYKYYEPYKHNVICESTSILKTKFKICE